MTTEELNEAIMRVVTVTPLGTVWTGDDFSAEQPGYEASDVDMAIATILNAVVSGQLVMAGRQ